MIFALGDDVTLTVYDDLAHVRRACRAVDVKHGFYRFFDDRGRPLTPVFVPPPVPRAQPVSHHTGSATNLLGCGPQERNSEN